MGALEDINKRAKSILKHGLSDDTSVHQLNRLYAVIFLIILAILISAKQYVGDPIACWCPAQFHKTHVKYADNYCWVKNTYSVPFSDSLPPEGEDRGEKEVTFYQWVPLIFVLQAFLFYLPRMFWKHFSVYSGINIKKALIMVEDATYKAPKERTAKLKCVASYLEKWIEIRDCISARHRKVAVMKQKLADKGLHSGNLLCFLFIVTGSLYTLSSIGQFFLLDLFLTNDFLTLGTDFIGGLASNKQWEDLRRFPRVTYCDFLIRQLNNVQTWTVQCSLPINLFNEKLFTLLWFVLVIISVVNATNLLYNIVLLFFPSRKHDYVEKFLVNDEIPHDILTDASYKDVKTRFVDKFLRQDGVLVIYLINHSTSSVAAAELVSIMWKNYCKTNCSNNTGYNNNDGSLES